MCFDESAIRRGRAALALLLTGALLVLLAPAARSDQPPTAGRPAPPFSLSDVSGKKRSPISEYRGRRIALFFFCGCSWCYDVATEWARLQRGGVLAAEGRSGEKAPISVVVYSGLDPAASRTLAAGAGLDPAQTVLLPEPDMRVTEKVYRAEPCPRVFVVDGRGVVRYTNTGKDDAPREAPAELIAARALDALRTALAKSKPESTDNAGGTPGEGRSKR